VPLLQLVQVYVVALPPPQPCVIVRCVFARHLPQTRHSQSAIVRAPPPPTAVGGAFHFLSGVVVFRAPSLLSERLWHAHSMRSQELRDAVVRGSRSEGVEFLREPYPRDMVLVVMLEKRVVELRILVSTKYYVASTTSNIST
jgi:hypothetical protein